MRCPCGARHQRRPATPWATRASTHGPKKSWCLRYGSALAWRCRAWTAATSFPRCVSASSPPNTRSTRTLRGTRQSLSWTPRSRPRCRVWTSARSGRRALRMRGRWCVRRSSRLLNRAVMRRCFLWSRTVGQVQSHWTGQRRIGRASSTCELPCAAGGPPEGDTCGKQPFDWPKGQSTIHWQECKLCGVFVVRFLLVEFPPFVWFVSEEECCRQLSQLACASVSSCMPSSRQCLFWANNSSAHLRFLLLASWPRSG
mmetsp:Transcript_50155/g.143430  ORF Transcript_50155/g.143430 Transcript_50155/m.143430 type:complete len:256 (+) Transcript_50155:1-768(+)